MSRISKSSGGKKILALFAALAAVLAMVVPAPFVRATVNSLAELQQAIDGAAGPTTIELEGEISLEAPILIPSGKEITLKPSAAGDALVKRAGAKTNLLVVDKGATLTLNPEGVSRIIFDANGGDKANLVVRGHMTLNDGVFTGFDGRDSSNYSEPGNLVIGEGAKLTMNGGAFTNNSLYHGDLQDAAANLTVKGGATFEMNGGEISKGKGAEEFWVYGNTGGLGLYDSATAVINGGKIVENVGGIAGGIAITSGSIYWDKPEDLPKWQDPSLGVDLVINGGEITKNKGGWDGGGIGAKGKFNITMNGGVISENIAGWNVESNARYGIGNGGGVSIYDYFISGDPNNVGQVSPGVGHAATGGDIDEWTKIVGASFIMNGGMITKNAAGATGGGVNVASSGVHLNGGEISENSVISHGARFGGGVYVAYQPYTLHMENVLLQDNDAKIEGGAIWNCPTGDTTVHLNNGAFFRNNKRGLRGRDVSVENFGHFGEDKNFTQTLPGREPSGMPLYWFKDGRWNGESAATFDPPQSVERVSTNSVASTSNYMSLAGANLAELAAQGLVSGELAQPVPNASLKIINNSAGRGGGIGTNGNVVIGTPGPPAVRVIVQKVWETEPEDNVTYPAEITVYLLANGQRVDRAVLHAGNNWTATFNGLPTHSNGETIEYTVEEVSVPGWTTEKISKIPGDQLTTVTVEEGKAPDPVGVSTAVSEADGNGKVQVTGTKDFRAVPQETSAVKLQLYRLIEGEKSGEAIDDPKEVTRDNNSTVWPDLPATSKEQKKYVYRVVELAPPVSGKPDIKVTNKPVPPTTPSTPSSVTTTPSTPSSVTTTPSTPSSVTTTPSTPSSVTVTSTPTLPVFTPPSYTPPVATPPETPGPSPHRPPLAVTGANVLATLAVAVGLAGAGLLLIMTNRRRNNSR